MEEFLDNQSNYLRLSYVNELGALRVVNTNEDAYINAIMSSLTIQNEALIDAINNIVPIQNNTNTYTYNYPNCIIQVPSYNSGETFYNCTDVIIIDANGCINDLYFEASEQLIYSTGSDFKPLSWLNTTQQYIPFILNNDARRTFVVSGNMESITSIKTKENWYHGMDYYRSFANWLNYDCGHLKQTGIFQIFLPSSTNISIIEIINQHLTVESTTNILLNLDFSGKIDGTFKLNGAPISSNGKIAIEKLKNKNWIIQI